MQTAIISLLVVGFLLFISTFFMKSQHKENEEHEKESEKMTFTKEEKQSLIENASIEIVEITQDKIEDAKDELEKISNEKLMAVGEFSDTVLGEMDKTHKEIMFLYNMLNEKEAEIKKLMEEKTNQAKLSKEEMDSLGETKNTSNGGNAEKRSAVSKSVSAKSKTRKSTDSIESTEETSATEKTSIRVYKIGKNSANAPRLCCFSFSLSCSSCLNSACSSRPIRITPIIMDAVAIKSITPNSYDGRI